MSTSAGDLGPASAVSSWRTPLVIIVCGCAIALLSFGPRSAVGFFVQPMSREFGYDRGTPVDRFYIENFLAAHGSGETLIEASVHFPDLLFAPQCRYQ